jgi:hypothetical protein
MNETVQTADPAAAAVQQRRVELARAAFKKFYAQCFWSYREDAEITEADIPWIIRELRHYGGAKGYRVVAELCR